MYSAVLATDDKIPGAIIKLPIQSPASSEGITCLLISANMIATKGGMIDNSNLYSKKNHLSF
jgi:hypothetical protein